MVRQEADKQRRDGHEERLGDGLQGLERLHAALQTVYDGRHGDGRSTMDGAPEQPSVGERKLNTCIDESTDRSTTELREIIDAPRDAVEGIINNHAIVFPRLSFRKEEKTQENKSGC